MKFEYKKKAVRFPISDQGNYKSYRRVANKGERTAYIFGYNTVEWI